MNNKKLFIQVTEWEGYTGYVAIDRIESITRLPDRGPDKRTRLKLIGGDPPIFLDIIGLPREVYDQILERQKEDTV